MLGHCRSDALRHDTDNWHAWWRLLLPLSRRFRWRHNKLPNLLIPRGFNEKLLRRIIFDRRPQLTEVAGKLGARAVVLRLTNDARLLPHLHAVVHDPAEIDTLELPERFVMKGNHGSGMVAFHTGPGLPDRAALKRMAAEWLGTDYGRDSLEWCYVGVERAVMFEEYLQAAEGIPSDYKFLCFGGRVEVIQYSSSRFSGHTISLFDRNWQILPAQLGKYPRHDTPTPRPSRFADMVALAEKLSAGWDFIRVDLYQVGEEIKFGELTNYPFGAGAAFSPAEWERRIGDYWTLA